MLSTVAVDCWTSPLRVVLIAPRKAPLAHESGPIIAPHRSQPGGETLARHTRHPREALLFLIIQAAGWPIWPLIICSIVALAVVIERLSSLRESRVAPAKLLDEVITVTRANLPTADVVNKLAESCCSATVRN